jgi:hypothetical protein
MPRYISSILDAPRFGSPSTGSRSGRFNGTLWERSPRAIFTQSLARMFNAVVDNDILLKACLYGLDTELADLLSQAALVAAVLPVARYVVRSRLQNLGSTGPIEAYAALERLIERLMAAEPSAEELQIAAIFESNAQRQNLELDGGESQLLAMVLTRGLRLLLTGDKRAIKAFEGLADPRMPDGFVCCLEQVVLTLVRLLGVLPLRDRVCREPSADRAITACFACRSPATDSASVIDGLRSYINDLRRSSHRVLIAGDDLSSLVT